MKKILYLDMDWVLADFWKKKNFLIEKWVDRDTKFSQIPNFFSDLEPIPWAIEAFEELYDFFDIYILSSPSWNNETSRGDKAKWIKKYLWEKTYKRLILTHRKDLNIWDFLVDDRIANWSWGFSWELIHFWQEWFENWEKVKNYLLKKI